MGEYADMAVDRDLNGYWEEFDGDWEDGPLWLGPRRRKHRLPTCKYCGLKNLVWRRHNESWRLFDLRIADDGGNEWLLHSCRTASAMSTGTAKTPKAVEGRSPASAIPKGDAHD